MDPNQNDQASQTPQTPVGGDAAGQNPITAPQPEPVATPVPEPAITPEPANIPEPTPAPTGDAIGQGQMEEITPPPPMVEEPAQNEQPPNVDQGNTGDTNPAV